MKITFALVIILFLSLFTQSSQAQNGGKEAKADLAIKFYSTKVFKTADTALINKWIKSTARLELKYITGSKMERELTEKKVLCNFILHNWNDVKNINEKLNAGFMVLSVFAKLKIQSPSGFNQNYIGVFDSSIQSLSKDEKIKLIGNAISLIGKAENLYESELEKLSSVYSIADTSLLPLFRGFVYKQLYPGIQNELGKYIHKTISESFTNADSLRGTLFPERNWWNVLRYDLIIKPDYETKTITGKNNMKYEVMNDNHPLIMQIDLQEPMQIDSIILNDLTSLDFKNYGNAWYVSVPEQENSSENSLSIYFHGKPREAKIPPWDGGWVWSKDSLGNPWMSVACQVLAQVSGFPVKNTRVMNPIKVLPYLLLFPILLLQLQTVVYNQNKLTMMARQHTNGKS